MHTKEKGVQAGKEVLVRKHDACMRAGGGRCGQTDGHVDIGLSQMCLLRVKSHCSFRHESVSSSP